jgi:hypothetical protein
VGESGRRDIYKCRRGRTLTENELRIKGTAVDVEGGRGGTDGNSPVELERAFLSRGGGSQRQQ